MFPKKRNFGIYKKVIYKARNDDKKGTINYVGHKVGSDKSGISQRKH